MDYRYSVFGLCLRSNLAIPGLIEANPLGSLDIDLNLGMMPEGVSTVSALSEALVFASSIVLESGEPAWRLWKSTRRPLFRLDYSDGVRFWSNSKADTLWATWPEHSSVEDAITYLLGPVLAFVLRIRGVICLHASAVNLGNHAIAFVGDAGAGKSTTAAALAQRGHPVISDDIVALNERDGAFLVPPAYPYLCLWPPSVAMLYGAEKALPPLSPNYEKRQLALTENSLEFQSRPLPLAAIYLLSDRSSEDRAPFLSIPSRKESLMSLIANSYTNLDERQLRAREFQLLGRLVSSIALRRLHAHQDGAHIGRLCELIEGHAKHAADAMSPDTSRSVAFA